MLIKLDIPIPPIGQNIIMVPIHYCGGHVVDAGGYGFEECKTGKWHCYRCSECKNLCTSFLDYGTFAIGKRPNYCPNCGAKMEVENNA